ncbi:MAG: chemotaxis protein CheW [Gammaproteobacteria bacterium]|nr:chemotaxis protein CheW [Gammaproteobacteria bacterium]
MANEENQINEPATEWVTFHLLDEKYAVNVTHVREVLKNTNISPVPGAPYFVLGIINLRGNIVTVIDSHSRLSLAPSEPTDSTRIVVVDMDGQVVGMMVDKVDEVVILKDSEIDFAPNVGNDDSSNFIHGVSQRDEELLILVDLDKMLALEQYRG